MKTIEEKIAVMQAFADGKIVEKYYEGGVGWQPIIEPDWDWRCYDYRVYVENQQPRTWEEFCEQHKNATLEYYVSNFSLVTQTSGTSGRSVRGDANLLETAEDAEGLLALIKLKRLRDAWVGDWQPNWKDDTRKFFVCERPHNVLATAEFGFDTERRNLLTFPTREMAEDFLACFAGLIKQAKMWL